MGIDHLSGNLNSADLCLPGEAAVGKLVVLCESLSAGWQRLGGLHAVPAHLAVKEARDEQLPALVLLTPHFGRLNLQQ